MWLRAWLLSGYGFEEIAGGDYMLSVIDRGADLLRAKGEISDETAAGLKAEARQRVERGVFVGHIAYASLIGRRPD